MEKICDNMRTEPKIFHARIDLVAEKFWKIIEITLVQVLHARGVISVFFIGTVFQVRKRIVSLDVYCLLKIAMSLVSDVVYDSYHLSACA